MKTRETKSTCKIAILATGDEISNGDIINSNSREIARRLTDLGMHIGMHAVTADNIAETEKMILFLLQSHQALIITGGLGPTSDDLTRFALSQAMSKALVFDETTWNHIVSRLKQFGYPNPPESNRQQALFPEGATIISNSNGTAAGCMLEHNKQFIFMLPGPPTECLPMIETTVIPVLKQHYFQQIAYHKSWMLFGVSEGQIAEELDNLAKSYDCMTGYRLFYPYIEFKIHSNNEKEFLTLANTIDQAVTPYLISEGTQTASDMLKKKLETLDYAIQICDQATGGLLESLIKTPKTVSNLLFIDKNNITTDTPAFHIFGLNEFWQQKNDCIKTSVNLNFYPQRKEASIETFNRGDRVKRFAAEWACYMILKELD